MMDIEMDSPMAGATSVVKRISLFPPLSTTKRAKLNQDEFTSLNTEMIIFDSTSYWYEHLQTASNDRFITFLLSTILTRLVDLLSETSAKDDFIPPSGVRQFVDDFNPNERQEWKEGIRKCMQLKDWTDLIPHLRLQKPEAIPDIDRASSETRAERAMRLHRMFKRQYQGDFHKLFVLALNDYEKIYNPEKHFGRIIPIIQSSGTGKSRMVREIGNDVPTLSICFRRSPLPESGWPPVDEPARNFLLGVRPHDMRFKGEELAAAFLGAVMAIVAEKLEAHGGSAPQKGDWMSDWRLDSPTDIADSRRYNYFTEVATKAENLLLGNREALVAERVLYEFQDDTVDTTIAFIDSAPLWHKRLFVMLCDPYFKKLSLILEKWDVKWFLLAIDECSDLNSTKSHPVTGNPRASLWGMSLIALQRIMKAYDDFVAEVPVWFLLLDTNSSLIDLSPSGKDAASDRFEKGFRTLPPWPYVGFNQMSKKNVFAPDNNNKLPTNVHCMQHLKFYGRPYWSTLTNEEVVGVAIKKLFSDDGFQPENEDHVFAAFAVRVGLEIGVGEASERLAMEAVRRHMRILEAVVGSMVITASPPEPMLAIAATKTLNSSEGIYKAALETLLEKLILKGVVLDRGLLGELSSRLLLLRARDKAGNGCVNIDPTSKQPTVQPVALSNFLQTLLGDTLGLPDNQCNDRDKLLKEASSVWINFTHIYQMPLSIGEVTESMLVNAWSTGAGFQCAHNQPVIDGFLVGYRGPLDKPFESSNLITIPWQSMAKSTAAASALAQSLTCPFILPQNGGSRYKPWHVVILMDLAASSAFGKATGPHSDLSCAKAVLPKRGEEGREVWKSYAETDESEGKRYCLSIRGHRANNYPVLGGVEKQFDILFMQALNCPVPEFVPYAEVMANARSMILD